VKTTHDLRLESRRASNRACLANMRGAALEYRMAICADTYRNLNQRGHDGVFSLELAMSYRDMARDFGKWRPGI
jgi:hypothetical protein